MTTMNITDYVKEVKNHSFYDLPINKLDILVFTLLSYIDFEGTVPKTFDRYHAPRLDQVAQSLTDLTPSPTMTQNHLDLLQLASQTLRYKSVKVMGYVNDIDPDVEKQFSATTFRLLTKTYLVAFRGTDDSIIGWKEDFHMTYMPTIPSQTLATAYLQDAISQLDGSFLVSGHSKGGNLATYSSSHLAASFAQKIEKIYSFDAPGLHHSVIKSPSYQKISPRIERFIPNGSIVGMMLEIPETAAVVQSTALSGISQHDPFSWKIEGHDFLLATGLNADSLQTDKTFKAWTASIPDEDLKEFWDLFFKLLRDADIESIGDFFRFSFSTKLAKVIENARNLSEEDAEMLTRVTRLLFQLRMEALREDLPIPDFFKRFDRKEDA